MSKVEIYNIKKITSGGFHAWYESNVGLIRKPTNNINLTERKVISTPISHSWFKRLLFYLKKLWQKIKTIFQKKQRN